MFNKKKYSIRKVSVGIASVLIGIAAGSLGTAYAHEDINNGVVKVEVNRNVDMGKTTLEKPEKTILVSETAPKSIAPSICSECKHEEKVIEHNRVGVKEKTVLGKSKTEEISLETTSTSIESVLSKPVSVEAVNKEEKLVESILEDKLDWNSIDEKEFVNYLLAGIKADKNKEQEIKTVWLVKVKELLAVNPNNENLKRVKFSWKRR